MAKANVRLDYAELEKMRDQITQFVDSDEMNQFFRSCAKELAARLLAKVIKRTPVGDYSTEIEVTAKRTSKKHNKGDVYTKRVNTSGKTGGTLRRGWTGGEQVSAFDYAQSLEVKKSGTDYMIEIINPTEYASYVEFGHRQTPGRYVPAIGKRLKQGWVEGKFMLTISEQEIQKLAPGLLEKKLEKYLKEMFR